MVPLAPKLIRRFGAKKVAVASGIFAGIAYAGTFFIGIFGNNGKGFLVDWEGQNAIVNLAVLTLCEFVLDKFCDSDSVFLCRGQSCGLATLTSKEFVLVGDMLYEHILLVLGGNLAVKYGNNEFVLLSLSDFLFCHFFYLSLFLF
jgi:hypothetical protein